MFTTRVRSRICASVLAWASLGWAAVAVADLEPRADAGTPPVTADTAPPQRVATAPATVPTAVPAASAATPAPTAPPAAPAATAAQRPPVAAAQPSAAPKWEQTSTGDGIITFKRDVPGSDIIALRGIASVAAPVARVASVLLDYTRAAEWIDDLEIVRVIRWLGPLEFIEYDRLGTPPLIMKDRDFVCRGKLAVDVREQSLVMTVEPATDPIAPPYGSYVRGELRGYWKLKAIDGGKHTLVVAEMHGDPKGGVPKWLVNLFQGGWARSTVESLRKQVAKPDIKVMPELLAAFAGKPFKLVIKSK